jgi:anti-sigma-K factor RskA
MSDRTDPRRSSDPGLSCDEVRDLAAPFVLGALDADEAGAVRTHLAACTDPHPEFAELGSVVPVLGASVPVVEPSVGLRDRILAAAAGDQAAAADQAAAGDQATAAAPAPAPTPTPTPFPTGAEREARDTARRTSTGNWILRIAAVLAITLLSGWNLLLQGQLSAAQTYEQSVAAVLDVAGRPGSLTAVLTAESAGGPAGLAAVDASGAVTLAMQDLAPTSGDQVYEAWVIGGDGVPVPLGDLSVSATGVASFQADGLPTDPGIVLALTLEPGPGATTPTLPIISLGTATSAG